MLVGGRELRGETVVLGLNGTNLNVTATCVLYSYDATNPGALPAVTPGTDFFGFRIDANKVQTLAAGSTLASTATCADAVWDDLTDDGAIEVTELTFDTIGSQCLAYEKPTYDPTTPATFKAWTTAAGTGVACAAGASNAPATYPSAATFTFVETRRVNIKLKAKPKVSSVNDPANMPERELNETVLVRNNRFTGPL